MIGLAEVNVALALMARAPLEGAEAKAVAVTIHKFEQLRDSLQPHLEDVEDENGDNADAT